MARQKWKRQEKRQSAGGYETVGAGIAGHDALAISRKARPRSATLTMPEKIGRTGDCENVNLGESLSFAGDEAMISVFMRIPFSDCPITTAFALALLAWAETESGMKGMRRAVRLAKSQSLRAKVTDLRGPKLAPSALKSMDEASVFLGTIEQIAKERRALDKLK